MTAGGIAHLGGMVGAVPRPAADSMSEDDRQEMLGSITEAHAALSEATFKLWRELSAKAPATKAAVKAEQEAFRLRREPQRLELANTSLAKVRCGSKVIGGGRERRPKGPYGEP